MPRCKNCKQKFEPVRFNQKFCFDSECVKVWVSEAKDQNWKKTKKKMKAEIETVQELMKAAQIVFNKYIRERDKAQPCISCGSKLEDKFDAGHYFSSGGHKAVTFDEDNVHGQCVACNQWKHGNLIQYQIGIEHRIGGERLMQLHEKAHKSVKYTREELRDLIKHYKEKIKQL
jgi:vacuolar-type H+-ATPase catalytic subunit A/Vma1